MFATQQYMDATLETPRKRIREDEEDLINGISSFSEHRNVRLSRPAGPISSSHPADIVHRNVSRAYPCGPRLVPPNRSSPRPWRRKIR
jgi:hypothetical protein